MDLVVVVVRSAEPPLHTATVNCILPSYNPALTQAVMDTLPPAVFIPDVTYGIALNVRTCRALAVSTPAGCAQSYTDWAICISKACGFCGSDAALAGCAKTADRSGCAAYVPEAACDVALARNAATADALCGPATVDYSNSARFKAACTLVAQAMCGE